MAESLLDFSFKVTGVNLSLAEILRHIMVERNGWALKQAKEEWRRSYCTDLCSREQLLKHGTGRHSRRRDAGLVTRGNAAG